VKNTMLEKIEKGLREYVLVLSIIIFFIGLFLFLMGLFNYIGMRNFQLDFFKQLNPPDWNAYILVFGLIVLSFGVYYLYSFLKKRKFVLDELKTDKRSEIIKKRNKLESTVKHLPKKYQRMLTEKEDEFNIK